MMSISRSKFFALSVLVLIQSITILALLTLRPDEAPSNALAVAAQVTTTANQLNSPPAVVDVIGHSDLSSSARDVKDLQVTDQADAMRSTQGTESLTASQIIIQEEAISLSVNVFEQALAQGVWDAEDTIATLPYLASLPDRERLALRDRFHTAVNNQELGLQDFPPF